VVCDEGPTKFAVAQQGASVYIIFDGALGKGIDFAQCSLPLRIDSILTDAGIGLSDGARTGA
jgi:hypothetical protein